jgi:hypothetical protein
MIAAGLLISLGPCSVLACDDDHKAQTQWLADQPSSWRNYGLSGKTSEQDQLPAMSLIAGGSGAIILLGALTASYAHAARPRVLQASSRPSRNCTANPAVASSCDDLPLFGRTA